MPAILGMRGTGQFPADHRAENWREKYLMLDPNGSAPLTAILAMLASEKTDDPHYHNFRKDLPDYRFTHSGSALAGDVTLTATSSADASFVRVGFMLRNYRTGEVVKVTAKPTSTTFTVTRGIGNSGTGIAVVANDIWFVVGNANAEGADVPASLSHDAASTLNYTQIFRNSFGVTRTAMHTNFRTGDQYKEKAADTLKEHMIGVERALLWGKRDSITGSTGEPERYTGGIVSYLTSNVLDLSATGIMSERTFDTFLAQYAFAFGSSQKLCLCGWRIADMIQQIGKSRWQINDASGDAYGMSITRYQTFAGELMVKTHPMFRQIPGAEKLMLILDTKDLRYRFIDDTTLLKDRQSPGVDGVTDEYLTECGLEMLQEKTHSMILGWNALS